ncbi:MAG: hypothetical protein DRO89_05385 [Candidatus Altiarchaeales archaeon]|nr:MAG: hypothetical protein DRO89_05385 [Candidatus Altiarchaeales archaeon]
MEEIDKERVGIRMDILYNIIEDLNNDPELQRIFGSPVSKSLVAVAEDNDIRIEEGGAVDLTEEETEKFLEILNRIIKANTI